MINPLWAWIRSLPTLRPRRVFGLAFVGMGLCVGMAQAQGLTEPVTFGAFDPDVDQCTPPEGFEPVLAFVQDNGREFMEGVRFGLTEAAADRGLSFEVVQAENDPVRQAGQLRDLIAAGVGAMVVAPVDPMSLAPEVVAALEAGAFVGSIVAPPATTLLNAPQYLTGKTLADAAATYIQTELGGQAKVVLLTHDSIQFLAPRFTAMRDTLLQIRGVEIVADISPVTVDRAGGAATMSTILLAHPDVDVVLGADTVVLGALDALRAAGRDRPDQFLGGIDGEPDAVAEIKAGGPYKATVALASPIFGYALGQHAADWLAGASVPQGMDILPIAITADTVEQYERDLADPAGVYADAGRRSTYLSMYGSICADTADEFVNFPWSSEAP